MRKFANGWTKETVRAQVKKFNNGSKALDNANSELCRYKNSEGNRCFIGAFIPNDHSALSSLANITNLLISYPKLIKNMPFEALDDLIDFQVSHDAYNDIYAALDSFLEGCE